MPLDQVDVDALARQEAEMSFLEHLEELRWHIIRAGGAILVLAVVVFVAKDFVFGTIVLGPTQVDFATYRFFCGLSARLGLGEAMCIVVPEFDWVTPVFGEQFLVHIRVSIILAFIASFPYVFWEFWRFIKPGLYEAEQRAARGTVAICSTLFLIGVLFGYFVIAPFAVTFLMDYELPGVRAAPALSSYIDYLALFTVPAGIVFQLPVFVYFLTRVGLLTSEFLRQYRRHAIVVLLALSAMITPPDVITQVLLGLPLFGLYEASILVAKRVEQTNAEREAAASLN